MFAYPILSHISVGTMPTEIHYHYGEGHIRLECLVCADESFEVHDYFIYDGSLVRTNVRRESD